MQVSRLELRFRGFHMIASRKNQSDKIYAVDDGD
jgi:hypothetical protein